MKHFLFLALLFCAVMTAGAYSAQSKPYEGLVDPEKMMKMKEISVFGVNLTMTVGEILSTLEKQGVKLECRGGGISCQVRTQTFNMHVQHKYRSKKTYAPGTAPAVDLDALPIAISFGQASGPAGNCAPVHEAIKIFCSGGADKPPCRTDNFGRIHGGPVASGFSSDGYRYKGDFSLVSPQQCGIRLEQRSKMPVR